MKRPGAGYRVCTLFLAVLLALGPAGCGNRAGGPKHEPDTPSGRLELLLEAFIIVDVEGIAEYAGVDNSYVYAQYDPVMFRFLEKLAANTRYKVLEESVDGDEAAVVVSITTFSGKNLMEDMMSKAMIYALRNSDNLDGDAFYEEYVQDLNVKKLSTVTNKVTVALYKSAAGDWMVRADDALLNALLGGVLEALEDMFGLSDLWGQPSYTF